MDNCASASTTSFKTGNFVSTSDSQGRPLGMTRVNDAVWILHEPSTKPPSMDIIFFHGLHFGDYKNAFWQTWLARGDESVIWPKHWLGKAFPKARILSISYNASLEEHSGQLDMYCLGENFVRNIIMDRLEIGQSCPIILVGHCLGGIVLKQFFLSAQRMNSEERQPCKKMKIQEGKAHNNQTSDKIDAFFENLKGVFYYGTPHGGSDITKFAKSISELGTSSKYIQLLAIHDEERVRMNEGFRKFRGKYEVRAFGMGEELQTTCLGFDGVVVEESSARCDIDFYYTATNADHFNVCRPENMETCAIFKNLHDFILDMPPNEEVSEDGFFENKQHLPRKIVGVDRLVNMVEDELQEKVMVGIVGMGGLGKTTLAKALFNKWNPRYEYSCFVPDVKLVSGTLEDLKNVVWKRMHHCGKRIAHVQNSWSMVRRARVLLVLDDVSQHRDFEVLSNIVDTEGIAADSRFIVTSRDKGLLNRCINAFPELDSFVYDMSYMSKEDSKQLFLNYALSSKPIPPPWLERCVDKVMSYMSKEDSKQLFLNYALSRCVDEVVDKCARLPLTLEVIGNHLGSHSNAKEIMEIWEGTLEALNKADQIVDPDNRLWAKLRLSFDALGEKEQEMFLDASVFFYSTWTLREAKATWGAMYGMEYLRWGTLVDRSLVYDVAEDEEIKVHEQLLSLGQKIACERNHQRRVCKSVEELNSLLSTDELDKKALSALVVQVDRDFSDIVIPKSSLGRLTNLQYLEVEEFDEELEDDSFTTLFKDEWREDEKLSLDKLVALRSNTGLLFGPFLLDLSRCRRLVVLNLDFRYLLRKSHPLYASSMKHLWSSVGGLEALKIFILYEVSDLDILPDEIGDLQQLERLELSCFESLRTLPRAFGSLARLKHLAFIDCQELDTLPDSFGQLSTLEHLSFDQCGNLRTLPKSFGGLFNLVHLSFQSCHDLSTLPKSFGGLFNLAHLSFQSCHDLSTLPKSFGRLSTLAHLSFHYCGNLHTLPESFGGLSNLAHLSFRNCPNLQTLPRLPSRPFPRLQFLEVHDCPRIDSALFFTGECPAALRHLRIGFLSLTSIPECVKSFPSLESLEITALPDVNEFPPWLGGTSLGRPAMSQWTFNVKDGKLVLQEEKKLDSSQVKRLIEWVHGKAMRKLGAVVLKYEASGAPDYAAALADLNVLDPEMLPHMVSGFILLERGILKRETRDLNGALKDVTTALEKFGIVGQIDRHMEVQEMKYRCLIHRGYIRCLAEDEEGARNDAKEALKFLVYCPVHPSSLPSRSLGLFGIEEWKEQAKLMLKRALQQAMEKGRASESAGALAALDVVRPQLLEEDHKSYFFQERGVLKRLLRDWDEALADLTDALEITFKDNYECRKHRGFFKYLLGDLDGARTDAERAMAIMPDDCEEWNNTMEVAPGNRGFLGNDPIELLRFTLTVKNL